LRRGELDRAIVGAVDLPCDIRHRVGALSDSHSPRSETTADGVTALVLKRLDAAKRDGDPVFAVIRQVEPAENDIASDKVAIGAATGLVRLTS
ncbi:hypothetical protein ABTN75_19695, partial [Acinetobacter baumannii]